MLEKLLPIGSVVRLQGGTKRVMIIGIRQTSPEDQKTYDYLAVLYPEGNMGTEYQMLFDHEAVEEICFRGYEDEERDRFIKRLEELLKQEK